MDYKDKKILVVGFGVEGKALVDYFVEQGAIVTVADQKTHTEFGKTYVDYYDKVAWQLGENYLDKLDCFDLIAFSPGLKYPVYQKIISSGVSTTTQMRIFFDQTPTKNLIGVTGTNGKGTTCTLIYEILKQAGKQVYLIGNIGNEALPVLKLLGPDDYVVIELSSYQLRDLHKSPHIGVVHNITPDHLDIHKDFDDYVECKANIIRFQNEDDFAVLSGDYPVTRGLADITQAKVVYFSKQDFIKTGYELKILGEHNKENAAAVLAVTDILGIDRAVVQEAFRIFPGLPHRLQPVASLRGVKFVDDSISTSPAPVMAAIQTFAEPKILICGGSFKSAQYEDLSQAITNNGSVKAVIPIGATGPKIKEALQLAGFKGKILDGFTNIEQVVKAAFNEAGPGDIVLLSPGDASFDWFKNYADRGEQFAEAVRKLQ